MKAGWIFASTLTGLCGLCLVLVGCKKPSSPAATTSANSTIYPPVSLSQFAGCTFQGPCLPGPGGTSTQMSLGPQFPAEGPGYPGALIEYWLTYSGNDCTNTANFLYEIEAQVTLTLGPQVAAAEDATRYQLSTPALYSITPSAQYEATMNHQGFCGDGNWSTHSWQTISPDNPCVAQLLMSPVPEAGILAFGVYDLYFGNRANTQIDTTAPYRPVCPEPPPITD